MQLFDFHGLHIEYGVEGTDPADAEAVFAYHTGEDLVFHPGSFDDLEIVRCVIPLEDLAAQRTEYNHIASAFHGIFSGREKRVHGRWRRVEESGSASQIAQLAFLVRKTDIGERGHLPPAR